MSSVSVKRDLLGSKRDLPGRQGQAQLQTRWREPRPPCSGVVTGPTLSSVGRYPDPTALVAAGRRPGSGLCVSSVKSDAMQRQKRPIREQKRPTREQERPVAASAGSASTARASRVTWCAVSTYGKRDLLGSKRDLLGSKRDLPGAPCPPMYTYRTYIHV